MKHLYILLNEHTLESIAKHDGVAFNVHKTEDADDLDQPSAVYLGTLDESGNNVTALAGVGQEALEGVSSLWSPFIRLTLHDCGTPVVVNRDHILMITKASEDDKDFGGATRIFIADYGPIHVTEPYDELEKLFASGEDDLTTIVK